MTLEELMKLREASTKTGPWEAKSIRGIPIGGTRGGTYDHHVVNWSDGVDTYDVLEMADEHDCAFIAAAHAALAPDGCLTKELERLRHESRVYTQEDLQCTAQLNGRTLEVWLREHEALVAKHKVLVAALRELQDEWLDPEEMSASGHQLSVMHSDQIAHLLRDEP